jgi:hypothetical protein
MALRRLRTARARRRPRLPQAASPEGNEALEAEAARLKRELASRDMSPGQATVSPGQECPFCAARRLAEAQAAEREAVTPESALRPYGQCPMPPIRLARAPPGGWGALAERVFESGSSPPSGHAKFFLKFFSRLSPENLAQ